MSAPLYPIPLKARAMWRDRDMTVVKLARLAGLSGTRAQHALSGHPLGLQKDRWSLARHLRKDECTVLGWDAYGNLLPVEQFSKAG